MAIEIFKRLVSGANNAHFVIKTQHRLISGRAVVLDAGIEDAEMSSPFTPRLQFRQRVPGAQAVCFLEPGVVADQIHVAIEVAAEG